MKKLDTTRQTCAAAVLIALAALAGCGDGPAEPSSPSLSGEWVGQVASELSTVSFDFRLSEGDTGTVTGTVSLQEEGLMLSGTVSGLHAHPNVSLTLEFTIAGQGTSLTYSGQLVSEDSMRGTVRFPDDPPLALELDRRGG
ncbi:hypothetical protein [Candidatus Palauibacter sp.]|uniref:hypothetical protein n=1 Tax=Candidatus Palauibacter sp. TaxID=3101350 RepID=UPI003AF2E74F